MQALRNLRSILKTIAQDVEVLPAVGGAVGDLERPDFGEREDQTLNEGEGVLFGAEQFMSAVHERVVGHRSTTLIGHSGSNDLQGGGEDGTTL